MKHQVSGFEQWVCARMVISALLGGVASAQPQFTGLGDLPGGAAYSDGWRISDDGAAVAGVGTLDAGLNAMRWSRLDGLARLGTLPGYEIGSFGTGVSSSGRVIVGYSESVGGYQAFRWTADGGMVGLGDLGGGPDASLAYNISADGAVVVGIGNQITAGSFTGEAFRWTQGGGMVGLGYTQGHHEYSDAWSTSGDGSVVVGSSMKQYSDGEAYVWTEATGMVGLGDLPGGDNFSTAIDVTPNGLVVVGGCAPVAGYEAFRWTQAAGMVALGDLPGGDHYSGAYAVTADGDTIVGFADWDGGFGGSRAFIWDQAHGMRDLKTVLETEYGLDLTGWQLLVANDISADGRYIVGQGLNPGGDWEAWIADLHRPCPGDFNGDGVVNTLDVLAFLNAWAAGC